MMRPNNGRLPVEYYDKMKPGSQVRMPSGFQRPGHEIDKYNMEHQKIAALKQTTQASAAPMTKHKKQVSEADEQDSKKDTTTANQVEEKMQKTTAVQLEQHSSAAANTQHAH